MVDICRSKFYCFQQQKIQIYIFIDPSNCCVFEKRILNQASANRPMRAVVQVAQAK